MGLGRQLDHADRFPAYVNELTQVIGHADRAVFERVVGRCIGVGLVGGEGFAVDASLIVADANKQRSTPGPRWKQLDAKAVSRATKERDLTVQLTGHDFLKSLEVELIPATAPDFFTEDTPTAVLVRQVVRCNRPIRKNFACRQAESGA